MNIIGFIRPEKELTGNIRPSKSLQGFVRAGVITNFYMINAVDFLEINDSQDRLENK
ncbi:MAG: hypothetical protein ACUZ8E_17565 [Candidatus Anammoxibacter sp.]